jgi:hypothetical protein
VCSSDLDEIASVCANYRETMDSIFHGYLQSAKTGKKQRNGNSATVRAIAPEQQQKSGKKNATVAPLSPAGGNQSNSSSSGKKGARAKGSQKGQNSYQKGKSGNGKGKPQGQMPDIKYSPCQLCPSREHNSTDCTWFAPSARVVASTVCTACGWEKFHMSKHCPHAARKEAIRQAAGQGSGSAGNRNGGN